MSKLFYWLIPLMLVSVFFALDIFIVPETTDTEQRRAQAYVAERQLEEPPYSFTHDGCSLFPDYLLWHDFRAACFSHDIAYWAGGRDSLRLAADQQLLTDIKKTGVLGIPLGYLMYSGVRIFGDSFVSALADAEWGYGWDD